MFWRPIALAVLITIVGIFAVRAQVTVDVAKITCASSVEVLAGRK